MQVIHLIAGNRIAVTSYVDGIAAATVDREG